jgi:hypothetical protein
MSIPGSLSGEYIMGLLRTWYPDTRMTQAAATAVASNPRNGEALRKLILGRTFDGHIVEAVLLSVASNPAWEFERVLDVLTSNPQLTRTILQSYGVVVRRDMNVHQVPELQIPGAWPQDPYITQSPPLEFIPYECSKFDRMRDWVERKLRMKVFWWPLDPPVTAGQENNMNMIWTCVRFTFLPPQPRSEY